MSVSVLTQDHQMKDTGELVYFQCESEDCRGEYVRGKIAAIEHHSGGQYAVSVKCAVCKEVTGGLFPEATLWAKRYPNHFAGKHFEKADKRCGACGWS